MTVSYTHLIKKQIRSKIGFMFQQGALFDSLSVGENVAFPMQEAGIRDENELDTRISAALDLSLIHISYKSPSGMKSAALSDSNGVYHLPARHSGRDKGKGSSLRRRGRHCLLYTSRCV